MDGVSAYGAKQGYLRREGLPLIGLFKTVTTGPLTQNPLLRFFKSELLWCLARPSLEGTGKRALI